MALTDAQELSLFEILDVPHDDSVDVITDEFGLVAQTREGIGDDWSVYAKVRSRIAALSTAEETRLASYITQWDALPLMPVALSGGMGGISGIDTSTEAFRERIRIMVEKIVPVGTYRDLVNRARRSTVSSVPVIR